MADEVGHHLLLRAGLPPVHAARRSATRRELGVPTLFNFLGPLTNPAQPQAQAIGCADARMAGVMAEVFARRGASALVFRGDDGLDELTTTTTSTVWVVGDGAVTELTRRPARARASRRRVPEDLRGGDRAVNAAVVRAAARRGASVRCATRSCSTRRRRSSPSTGTVPADDAELTAAASRWPGTTRGEAVDSGAAAAVLDRWVAATQRRTA